MCPIYQLLFCYYVFECVCAPLTILKLTVLTQWSLLSEWLIQESKLYGNCDVFNFPFLSCQWLFPPAYGVIISWFVNHTISRLRSICFITSSLTISNNFPKYNLNIGSFQYAAPNRCVPQVQFYSGICPRLLFIRQVRDLPCFLPWTLTFVTVIILFFIFFSKLHIDIRALEKNVRTCTITIIPVSDGFSAL